MSLAFVLVQCTIGHEMEVLRDLLKLDSVKEAKGTFGYYDLLVKIIASSNKEIEKVITNKIVIFGFRSNIEFLELTDLALVVVIFPYEILV